MATIIKMTLRISLPWSTGIGQHPENRSGWRVQLELGSPAQGNPTGTVTSGVLRSEKEGKAFPKGVREWLLNQHS